MLIQRSSLNDAKELSQPSEVETNVFTSVAQNQNQWQ